MKGDRRLFSCASCGNRFFYWVLEGNAHPRVKCYFCGVEFFPHGEPPAAAAPDPTPAPAAAAPAAGASTPAPSAPAPSPAASTPAIAASTTKGEETP